MNKKKLRRMAFEARKKKREDAKRQREFEAAWMASAFMGRRSSEDA